MPWEYYICGLSRKKGRCHWYMGLIDSKSSYRGYQSSSHFGQGAVRGVILGVGTMSGRQPRISQAILVHFLPISHPLHTLTQTSPTNISHSILLGPGGMGQNTHVPFARICTWKLPVSSVSESQWYKLLYLRRLVESNGTFLPFTVSEWKIILWPSHPKKIPETKKLSIKPKDIFGRSHAESVSIFKC